MDAFFRGYYGGDAAPPPPPPANDEADAATPPPPPADNQADVQPPPRPPAVLSPPPPPRDAEGRPVAVVAPRPSPPNNSDADEPLEGESVEDFFARITARDSLDSLNEFMERWHGRVAWRVGPRRIWDFNRRLRDLALQLESDTLPPINVAAFYYVDDGANQ